MVANDNAISLKPRVGFEFFASKLAPTGKRSQDYRHAYLSGQPPIAYSQKCLIQHNWFLIAVQTLRKVIAVSAARQSGRP